MWCLMNAFVETSNLKNRTMGGSGSPSTRVELLIVIWTESGFGCLDRYCMLRFQLSKLHNIVIVFYDHSLLNWTGFVRRAWS